MADQSRIRNFAIVAHVDHGKSTLADRLLEITGTIAKRDMIQQVLDSNPIEKERGITIKLAPVRMIWKPTHLPGVPQAQHHLEGVSGEYILNLIDTPGHVDFSYEVSRSLAACEGVVLVVDATQGVQAQTLAYMQQVVKRKLKVIPVINKIDHPLSRVAEAKAQMQDAFGFESEEFISISAKTGENVDHLLEVIVNRIPEPKGDPVARLRMLVFSSFYEAHRGVVCYSRVIDGEYSFGEKQALRFMAGNLAFKPVEVGYFTPKMINTQHLKCGEVGYIATGFKDIHEARVGDTITLESEPADIPLKGYQEPKQMVFMGLFPVDTNDFEHLRDAIDKLHLQDGAFTYRSINSPALGFGFHCGFLGRLHADIVAERLEREFDVTIIRTLPQVSYILKLRRGDTAHIEYAVDFPDPSQIEEIQEPVMITTIFSSKEYVGAIMDLMSAYRGTYIDLTYLGDQVKFEYLVPLAELIVDFFDRLKTISSGYASVDFEFYEYRKVKAVKMDILVHHNRVDALSVIVVEEKAVELGKFMTQRLKESIPKHNFEVPIQATIGGKIVAREDIKAYRKDVTAKLYGGDRTRKDKLLDTQKKGKKKMKMLGKVEIPKEAFLSVLRSK